MGALENSIQRTYFFMSPLGVGRGSLVVVVSSRWRSIELWDKDHISSYSNGCWARLIGHGGFQRMSIYRVVRWGSQFFTDSIHLYILCNWISWWLIQYLSNTTTSWVLFWPRGVFCQKYIVSSCASSFGFFYGYHVFFYMI